jgi:DNA polymerase III delta prime subunit
MFENIIGQAGVTRALGDELSGGTFPRASLFAGPPYTGKLSTALEAARVLCCGEGRGEWSCECTSCAMHKELAHPHTVLLGPRYSEVEIAASADSLVRTRRQASRYLFLRAVRKLTRRYDPAVFDAEDAKMKAVQARVAAVEDMLLDLSPAAGLPEGDALESLLSRVVEACGELSELARIDAISVGQVRLLAAWAHETSESRKVAILENADRMLDSAKNALLKLLEEPPGGVHLVLLTTRRSAMLPTVVSRLRPYLFAPRSPGEEAEVLERIFRTGEHGRSLRGFFLAWKQINAEALAEMSRSFVDSALFADQAGDILGELDGLFKNRRNQKDATTSFLEEVTHRLCEMLRAGEVPLEISESWAGLVREGMEKLETLNITASNVVENLYLRMRESAAEARSGPAAGVEAGGAAR